MKMKKIIMTILMVCVSWNVSALELNQLQFHGFASQGYLISDQYDYMGVEMDDGTVEFNEFGLNVMSNLMDRLRMGIQFLARDFGNSGNDHVTIDWAFADYRYRNWLGVRIGQFNRALGLYNQSRDIDAARTGVFLPYSVYNEANRVSQKSVKGIALYGTTLGAFEYQIQYGTLDSGFKDVLLTVPGTTSAEVEDDAYVLHLIWNTPVTGLRVVGTFDRFSWSTVQTVDTARVTSNTDFKKWLAGIEYIRDKLTCAAEYSEGTIETSGTGGTYITTQTSGTARTYMVYYGLLNYRLTDLVEVGAVYSEFYPNKDDKAGDSYALRGLPKSAAWTKDLAVTARFDLNEYWIAKLEGHWINGLGGIFNYGKNPDENGFMLAAKVTVSF